MAELGSNSTPRSDYPGALDVNAVTEVDSPSASKTLITAAKIDDGYAAIINIETELGTDPAGTKTDVKTYLQTEHNADATHKSGMTLTSPNFTGTMTGNGIIPLARIMTQEESGASATAWTTAGTAVYTTATLNVVTGDRIYIYYHLELIAAATSTGLYLVADQASGTATGDWFDPTGGVLTTERTVWRHSKASGSTEVWETSGVVVATVDGTGTAVLTFTGTAVAADATSSLTRILVQVMRGA